MPERLVFPNPLYMDWARSAQQIPAPGSDYGRHTLGFFLRVALGDEVELIESGLQVNIPLTVWHLSALNATGVPVIASALMQRGPTPEARYQSRCALHISVCSLIVEALAAREGRRL